MWIALAIVVLIVAGLSVIFARGFGPTRSVAHVLYDTEHPPKDPHGGA